MDIFSTYATDETKENGGVWVEIGDAEFLIARAGNAKYNKLLAKTYERNRKLLERKDEAADKLAEQMMVDVMATTILLDWKNVQWQGKDFPYSEGNAKALLNIKDFRKQVSSLSEDFTAYQAAEEEAQAKN